MALVRKAAPSTTFVSALVNRRVVGGGGRFKVPRIQLRMLARADAPSGRARIQDEEERRASDAMPGRAAPIPTETSAPSVRPPPSVSRGAAAGTLRTVERLLAVIAARFLGADPHPCPAVTRYKLKGAGNVIGIISYPSLGRSDVRKRGRRSGKPSPRICTWDSRDRRVAWHARMWRMSSRCPPKWR